MNEQTASELATYPEDVRRASDILYALRVSPTAPTDATADLEPPNSARAERLGKPRGGGTRFSDPTPIDQRSALHLWLLSIEAGLAGYRSDFDVVVRERLGVSEADSLWRFLTEIESSFSLHVLGGEESTFLQLCKGCQQVDVNRIEGKFREAFRKLARTLRVYRRAARRLDDQEQREPKPPSQELHAIETILSGNSDEIVQELSEAAKLLADIMREIRNFVPEGPTL